MNDRIIRWGGRAVVALAVVGGLAFVSAILALCSGNLSAAGICFVACAIAFNGIATVVFRR